MTLDVFRRNTLRNSGHQMLDVELTKVQVGKDQEKAQSEKDFHSKNRDEKKLN